MWPFNKKKLGKEQLNRLSESEIQSKLYGHYDVSEDKELTLKTSETKPAKSVSVQAISNSPSDLFPPTTKLENLEAISNKNLNDNYEDEVVENGIEESPYRQPSSQEIIEQEEVASEEETEDDVSSFSSEEEVVTQKQYIETMIPPKWEKSPKLKKKEKVKESKTKVDLQIGLKVQSFFKKFGQVILGALVYVVRVPQAFFHWCYHNRRVAKKVALWGVGVAVVVFLFVSVHYLNVNREKAMTGKSRYSQASRETTVTKIVTPPAAATKEEVAKTAGNASSAESNAEEKSTTETTTTSEAQSNASVDTADSSSTESTSETSSDSSEVPTLSLQSAAQGTGEYVVQVATYAYESDANRMTNEMIEQGWPTFVQGLSRAGGRIYYSVFLGRFETYASAQEVFGKFKKTDIAEPFSDAFIRKLRKKNQ